jgi:putative protease
LEEKRPGEYFPVEEDDRGTYIFSAKDLCLLNRLPELAAIGIDALKIEGRMKSTAYVGSVVRIYRAALDWIADWQKEHGDFNGCKIPAILSKELENIGTRGQTENFFNEPAGEEAMNYKNIHPIPQWTPAGVVRSVTPLIIETKINLAVGDTLVYLGPGSRNVNVTIDQLIDGDGNSIQSVHPSSEVILVTKPPLVNTNAYGLLRKKITPKKSDSSSN